MYDPKRLLSRLRCQMSKQTRTLVRQWQKSTIITPRPCVHAGSITVSITVPQGCGRFQHLSPVPGPEASRDLLPNLCHAQVAFPALHRGRAGSRPYGFASVAPDCVQHVDSGGCRFFAGRAIGGRPSWDLIAGSQRASSQQASSQQASKIPGNLCQPEWPLHPAYPSPGACCRDQSRPATAMTLRVASTRPGGQQSVKPR